MKGGSEMSKVRNYDAVSQALKALEPFEHTSMSGAFLPRKAVPVWASDVVALAPVYVEDVYVVWSYATVVAVRVPLVDGAVLVMNPRWYSMTTAKHKGVARSSLPVVGFLPPAVPDSVDADTWGKRGGPMSTGEDRVAVRHRSDPMPEPAPHPWGA